MESEANACAFDIGHCQLPEGNLGAFYADFYYPVTRAGSVLDLRGIRIGHREMFQREMGAVKTSEKRGSAGILPVIKAFDMPKDGASLCDKDSDD